MVNELCECFMITATMLVEELGEWNDHCDYDGYWIWWMIYDNRRDYDDE